MKQTLSVAVAGLGYWGPNLVRNFAASDCWRVAWAIDLDQRRLERVRRTHPACRTTTRFDDALEDEAVDLVAVATPPATHAGMATCAIRAGKHVLVEKPLAETSRDAAALLREANAAGVRLFTDHTFLYTGAVETMRGLRERGELGQMYYAESQRVNLGLFQQSNVVWDLAPHDLSIFNDVFGSPPTALACHARACVNPLIWDVAFLHLRYANDCVAAVHLSWLSPVKVRRMMLSGSERMVLWDDVDPSEKLRIYDKGVLLDPSSETLQRQMVSYRLGDVRIPVIDEREALAKLAGDLWGAIRTGASSRIDGTVGYDVVRCIEAACTSARTGGSWVTLRDAAQEAGSLAG